MEAEYNKTTDAHESTQKKRSSRKHICKPFLFKVPSEIHGTGIFTQRDINKGEVFYDIPLKVLFHELRPRCAFIGNNSWVSDEEVLNYINHSCDPNTKLDLTIEPRLVAVRTIRMGEEITVDYNLTERGGNRVSCNCQSSNCGGYFLRKE